MEPPPHCSRGPVFVGRVGCWLCCSPCLPTAIAFPSPAWPQAGSWALSAATCTVASRHSPSGPGFCAVPGGGGGAWRAGAAPSPRELGQQTPRVLTAGRRPGRDFMALKMVLVTFECKCTVIHSVYTQIPGTFTFATLI